MIGDSLGTSLRVEADSTVISSRDAVSLGLIVTELVMNALKHAFPENRSGTAIVVSYRAAQSGWRLAVCDNGAGGSNTDAGKHGIGTVVIQAFARQLDAASIAQAIAAERQYQWHTLPWLRLCQR